MKGGYIFYPNVGMPKKAKWLAVHSDGRIHLFAKKPSKDRSGYWQMKLPGYNEPADLLPGIFKAGMLYRLVPRETMKEFMDKEVNQRPRVITKARASQVSEMML